MMATMYTHGFGSTYEQGGTFGTKSLSMPTVQGSGNSLGPSISLLHITNELSRFSTIAYALYVQYSISF